MNKSSTHHQDSDAAEVQHAAEILRLHLATFVRNCESYTVDPRTLERSLRAVDDLVDQTGVDYGHAAGKRRGWLKPSEVLGLVHRKLSHDRRCPGIIEYSGMQCAVCGGA